jgi:hypothetical protein
MNDSIFEWLDEGARADIEKMRQPKPMPPAKKKKTVTRYADMTPKEVNHKRKLKKKWMNENHERMLAYWVLYRQQHREECRAACRKWQAKFMKEHGVSYTTWRRWKQTPEGRERIAAWEAEHGKEQQ